jgi:hypothetical protein
LCSIRSESLRADWSGDGRRCSRCWAKVDEMTEDELFYAWLDDELEGEDAERVAARVAADPALMKEAEQHRRLAAQLRGAFDPVLKQDIPPPRFEAAEVVDFQAKRLARDERRASFGLPQWAAMAATLAMGIVAGQFVGDRSGAPIESRDGMLVAAASLDRALDAQLASADGNGRVRVGLTFRARDGGICRSFTDGGANGLACRDGQDWRVEGLFAAPEGQQGDYRMAAGEDPRLAALIDEHIAGEPFDAAAERAARDGNWR